MIYMGAGTVKLASTVIVAGIETVRLKVGGGRIVAVALVAMRRRIGVGTRIVIGRQVVCVGRRGMAAVVVKGGLLVVVAGVVIVTLKGEVA